MKKATFLGAQGSIIRPPSLSLARSIQLVKYSERFFIQLYGLTFFVRMQIAFLFIYPYIMTVIARLIPPQNNILFAHTAATPLLSADEDDGCRSSSSHAK
jgi:hypothetical protein